MIPHPVGDFHVRTSASLHVGDIIKMVSGKSEDGLVDYSHLSSSFPADLLFLSSSHQKGHCFVETASLDGNDWNSSTHEGHGHGHDVRNLITYHNT